MASARLRKVGFYGGSFDPIHFGHIHLALSVKEQYQLDEIWFCPNYLSPFKTSTDVSSFHRLNMLKLALEELAFFKLIDLEIKTEKTCYTYNTLNLLKEQNPFISFYLIIADDQLPQLYKWKNIDQLIKQTPLIIGRRCSQMPSFEATEELHDIILNGYMPMQNLIQISSTFIKKRIKQKLYINHLLPKKVVDYIYQHQLYS
jgi:nicotinate-nucleotide adenylyltransferase